MSGAGAPRHAGNFMKSYKGRLMIAKDLQLIPCKILRDHGPVGGGIAGLAG
jgi:hypothetical protein